MSPLKTGAKLEAKVTKAPAVTRLLVTRVGPCIDRKATEVAHVSEMSLYRKNSTATLSGQLAIRVDVDNGWTIRAPAVARLLVTRVGPCIDRKSTEVAHVSEMSLYRKNSTATLSGQLAVRVDVDNEWTIRATMQKCHDIRNLDTCDFYKSAYIVKYGCEDSEDADVFNNFFKCLTPKLECPIRAGNYTIKNYLFFSEESIPMTSESKISTSVFGYTYRVEGFNEQDDRLLCVDSHLRMVYVRHHDWADTLGRGAIDEEEDDADEETL